MNKEQVKQELHALIDNLDVEKATNCIAMMMNNGYSLTVIDVVKEKLFMCQKPKAKTYWNTRCIEQIFHSCQKNKLHCQKPKEKTLEQKLIDAGFEQLMIRLEDGLVGYANINCAVIIDKIKSNVRVCYNLYHIYDIHPLQNHDGKTLGLTSNVDNHDQIFADIAYLESRIK